MAALMKIRIGVAVDTRRKLADDLAAGEERRGPLQNVRNRERVVHHEPLHVVSC